MGAFHNYPYSNDEDPLRQVSFAPSSALRVDYGKKCIGRPGQNWFMFSKKMLTKVSC